MAVVIKTEEWLYWQRSAVACQRGMPYRARSRANSATHTPVCTLVRRPGSATGHGAMTASAVVAATAVAFVRVAMGCAQARFYSSRAMGWVIGASLDIFLGICSTHARGAIGKPRRSRLS